MQRKERKPLDAGRHWLADLPAKHRAKIERGLRADARRAAKFARQETAARAAGSFRPAITADGALLLIGVADAGELNSAETRVLADFLARVDRSGARA